MRKKVFGRKLGRDRGSRAALFRSLVKALLERGKIVTTKAKVKAFQPDVEQLVTCAKKKDLSFIRKAYGYLGNDKKSLEILFGSVAKAFATRNSGYTRTINLPNRKGDNAEMASIEWTEKVVLEDVKNDKKKAKKEKKVTVKEKEEGKKKEAQKKK
jgi:large subunit ribosomal protein L17